MVARVVTVVETVRVEVPVPPDERVICVMVKEAVGPEGDTLAEMATVLEKPFRLVSVIVEVTEPPA